MNREKLSAIADLTDKIPSSQWGFRRVETCAIGHAKKAGIIFSEDPKNCREVCRELGLEEDDFLSLFGDAEPRMTRKFVAARIRKFIG